MNCEADFLRSPPPALPFHHMESAEVDIKPTIPADDISNESLHTVPSVCKLRHSRYEDVWPEDVHAAFMEGQFYRLL